MRFHLGQIPVTIRPAFFLIAVALGFTRLQEPALLASWTAIVIVSVLIHELGHAVAFIRFGHAPSIELNAVGGLTRGSPGVNNRPMERVLMCLAGPTAGFMVGGLVYFGVRWAELSPGPFAEQLIRDVLWVNIGWGVVNLLPVWPLDGGQAVAALLEAFVPTNARRIGLGLSTIIATVLAGGALYVRMPLAAMFAMAFGVQNFRQLRRLLARGPDHTLDQKIAAAYVALQADVVHEARQGADEVLAAAQNPLVRADALHLLGWTELRAESPERAMAALARLPEGYKPDPGLLGAILLRTEGREHEAIEPLQKAFADNPSESTGRELVAALLNSDDIEGAYAVVEGSGRAALSDDTWAQVEAACFYAGRFESAYAISEGRFRRERDPNAAYNAACSAARLDRPDDAVNWLKRALSAGFDDRPGLATDEDLAILRGRSDFQALVADQ